MPEQQTTPQPRESAPRTDWDIGKAMNGLFGGPAVAETPSDEAPEEGTAALDGEEQDVTEGEDAGQQDEGTPEDKPFLVAKVDGKDIPVKSAEEAIPLVQKGLHYTQEMQKLRDEQRRFENERETMTTGLRHKESQYSAALETLSQTYGFVLGQSAPDWASPEMQQLKAEKPSEYLAIREQWDQLGAIRSELGRINREKQEAQQKEMQAWVKSQQEALAEKAPEWADPSRRQQDYTAIRDYAAAYGVTEPELANLFDHRYWLILRDAARYKQAEAAGKTKREAVASKTAEPGSGKNVNQGERGLRAQRERLRETGDVRVAGDLLHHMMTKPKR